MSTISTASAEWPKRPADERFESLYALRARSDHMRQTSRGVTVANRRCTMAHGTCRAGLPPTLARPAWRSSATTGIPTVRHTWHLASSRNSPERYYSYTY